MCKRTVLSLLKSSLTFFVRFDVGISISIDGPSDVHDRFRVDKQGQGSYDRVRSAIALADCARKMLGPCSVAS